MGIRELRYVGFRVDGVRYDPEEIAGIDEADRTIERCSAKEAEFFMIYGQARVEGTTVIEPVVAVPTQDIADFIVEALNVHYATE